MICVSDFTSYGSFNIDGTICAALQPAPTTTTSFPLKSISLRQRAEWKTSPWKVSWPTMFDGHGLGSTIPAQLNTIFARTFLRPTYTDFKPDLAILSWRSRSLKSPVPGMRYVIVASHSESASIQRSSETSVFSLILETRPYLSTMRCKYLRNSSPVGYNYLDR